MTNSDIVIIGDSFCAHRTDLWDWPRVLTKMLTGVDSTPRGKGFGGAAWWSTRQCLLEELQVQTKVLILCHTQQDRIHSDSNLGMNSGVAWGLVPVAGSDDPEVTTAVKYYYRYLHSYKYHEWAMTAWIKELETLTVNIPKVIHLPCFPLPVKDYVFKTGVTVYPHLDTFVIENTTTEPVRNHFTQQQNLDLAKMLFDLINNYTPGVVHHDKI